jgi:hypothetical protein
MKSSKAWLIGGCLALAGAVGAAVVGYEVTGWALVRPSGPTVLDYVIFAGLTAGVAAVGAIPGLVVGLLIRWIARRGNGPNRRPRAGGDA